MSIPASVNKSDIIEQPNYYDDVEFKNALQRFESKISLLSLNGQSINAKFDKLKLFLDDVNNINPISVIMCSGELVSR